MGQHVQPKIGMRFVLRGAKFEVTFVAHGIVRYAASAGGNPFKVPIERFLELQEQGTIELTEATSARIGENNAPILIRRHRYVEAALRQLTYPTSVTPLKALIEQVSAEYGDTSVPSPRSLARWIRSYQRLGATGLERLKFSGNHTVRFDLEVERLIGEAIQQTFLKRERRNAQDVLSYVVGKLFELGLCDEHSEKVKIPTLRTIQRRLKELDPFVVIQAQRGDLAAHRAMRSAGQAIKSVSILSIVQIDTHYLDVLVIDPDTGEPLGRPYLTCILDIHTRMVVGVHVSIYPPSSTTALAALKYMLVRYGIPAQIVPDGGPEFVNTAFARVCAILMITITQAQVRDPNGKANIESFFRVLTYDLIQKLCGTTFSNPADRGDYDSMKQACLTMAQVADFIDVWLVQYHQSVHSRTGRAPILAWEDQAKVVPPIKMSEDDVNTLARQPVIRTIQHGRVRISGIEYFSHALATCSATGEKRVTVLINELDLNTVLVQHPTDKDILILAESTDPYYTRGLTSYAHKEAMLTKREMSAADRKKFGRNANAIARWRLLERIHSECKAARKWIAKLTGGKGRKVEVERQRANMPIVEILEEPNPQIHESDSNPTIKITAMQSSEEDTLASSIEPFGSLELE